MNNFSFFSKCYTFLWSLILPFLRYHKRLREGFTQRLVPEGWATPATVWIQAASGGEAYLVSTLLEHLPFQHSTLHILLTTWTPQGRLVLEEAKEALASSRKDLSIQVQFFPFDQPLLMEKALTQVNPRLVVLIEADLWPGLLLACSKKEVPVLVLNGRVREKSLKGYDWISWIFPEFWRAVAPRYVAAISSGDAARFTALFGEYCVGLVPNIKFDRAAHDFVRVNNTKNTLVALLPQKPVVLLASVREEEEPLLLPIVKHMYSCWKDTICIIIAPRHIHRVSAWTKKLRLTGLPMQLRSSLSSVSNERSLPIVVWDRFGELEALYNVSQAIFVGGSLVPLGGQNFLEPLSVGKVPCVGKYLDNFSWVFEPVFDGKEIPDLSFASLIKICSTPEELEYQLEYQLEHPQSVEYTLSSFNSWLEQRKGGVDTCVSLMMNILEQ